MRADLESARIKSLPDDGFYIANFISEDEEEFLLRKALWGGWALIGTPAIDNDCAATPLDSSSSPASSILALGPD
ncbi:uncharacterized protein AKAW2_31169A [Aspergillus luchuensis]|nr:uncharacterized protein AKAW2_31169A [Aspergillus luchuensis]BCR97850.1 hypothetical protein AKAW2_31169A [Aspergillus luchuensis]